MPPDQPTSIDIPSPPALLADHPSPDPESERTNTYALLLPHISLFSPAVLSLLRDYYEQYGTIAHWAPVRGFGRAIVVWEEVEDAERAKKEGDWLRLDVDVDVGVGKTTVQSEAESGTALTREKNGTIEKDEGEKTYFSPRGTKRRSKALSKGITLRLHPLPFTPLHPDPSQTHLRPPQTEKNFLISPPGSPPEGWEPILEDAPNVSALAEDLQKALERLQLNGNGNGNGRWRSGGKEVILDEGGVRVEVEDTSKSLDGDGDGDGDGDEDGDGNGWEGVEERMEGGDGAWKVPMQDTDLGTPSGRMRIAPTAMPPR